jgi:ABC-type transporter Mla maintaining outer membrane lipid asymmetry permease subunit MlaE
MVYDGLVSDGSGAMGTANAARIGVFGQLSWVLELFVLLGGAARLVVRGQVSRARTLGYVRAVGMESTPLLVFVALPVSTLIIMGQGSSSTSSHLLSSAAVGLFLHNIAPLVVTGIVLLRWPAAESAEIGLKAVAEGWTASALHEEEVLRTVVAPAIVGTSAGMVCLWGVHLLLIVIGGILATVVALGVPMLQLFVRIATSMSFLNLAAGLLFTALCGAVVAAATVQSGLEARTLGDIPRAARHGQIRALIAAAILGLFMTVSGGHWP